jgi:hypothetical protein
MRIRLGALALSSLACLFLAPASPALATFHLVSISEVYAGSAAHPDSGYVELQMWEPEQNFVVNHSVFLYDASGGAIGTFTFPANLPGVGVNQQTMLVGDSDVASTFGVTPDLVDSGLNLPASGGAACWDTLDCVAWGDFHGTVSPPTGAAADGPGLPDGTALRRRVSGGTCANILDEADDTNDSGEDFFDAAPTPQSYATVPAPVTCTAPPPTPTVAIDSKPAFSTNATSASFAFHSSPAGATFQCRLDLGAYQACDTGSVAYPGPLAEGLHSFRVRAANGNGTGTPASYTWAVDLTPPEAAITTHPADPSPGKSASFRYSSSEGGSKFECRLTPVEASFAACNTQPKAYSNLADGDYEFEVRAEDAAGNLQPSPTVFAWTVDNSLLDTTPPETSIVSKPPDPSSSPVAAFTYSSNEAGSSFQCKLDGGGFNSCPASGITYTGLGGGPHTFQVRAIDPSDNVDPSPAGYSFEVVLEPAAGAGATPAQTRPGPATPNTRLSRRAPRTRDRTPTFRFGASTAGARFQCKVDRGPFKPCRSPFTTTPLSYGKHVFQVRAIASGRRDRSPAKLVFKVVRR